MTISDLQKLPARAALFADSERFNFKMDAEKAERLRYLLGRALDPANEPPRYRS